MICRRKFRQCSSRDINAGAVNVIQVSSPSDQLWTQDPLTGTSTEPNDRFGWSLAAGDFDNNGRDDLAGSQRNVPDIYDFSAPQFSPLDELGSNRISLDVSRHRKEVIIR